MPSSSISIDAQLIKRLVNGDEIAFKKVYNAYYDKLYFYCLKFVKSEDFARELIQDVFVKLWTQRAQINPDLSLNAYLYTITRNHTLDFLKKVAKDQQLKEALLISATLAHTEAEDNLIFTEYDTLAKQAIQNLPSQRRLIFQLSRRDGLSYEEIANTLSISKNTVKVQMLRALKAIREYLQMHTDLTISILFCLSLLF